MKQILHYNGYKDSPIQGSARDRFRHVITLQLTRLLMNQNLELSLCSYLSLSDQDAYLKPRIKYKWTDDITVEIAANIFTGNEIYTFFGQFEDNTNAYTAIRL